MIFYIFLYNICRFRDTRMFRRDATSDSCNLNMVGTNRKLSSRAFHRCRFHQIYSNISHNNGTKLLLGFQHIFDPPIAILGGWKCSGTPTNSDWGVKNYLEPQHVRKMLGGQTDFDPHRLRTAYKTKTTVHT